jgi:hypothetical protein
LPCHVSHPTGDAFLCKLSLLFALHSSEYELKVLLPFLVATMQSQTMLSSLQTVEIPVVEAIEYAQNVGIYLGPSLHSTAVTSPPTSFIDRLPSRSVPRLSFSFCSDTAHLHPADIHLPSVTLAGRPAVHHIDLRHVIGVLPHR